METRNDRFGNGSVNNNRCNIVNTNNYGRRNLKLQNLVDCLPKITFGRVMQGIINPIYV